MKRTEFRGVIGSAALEKDQSQDMEIEITDMVGLSKPMTRLVEVMAQGIGAVSRSYLTRRDADAEAYKIQKIADAIKGVEEQNQLPVVYDGGKIEIWQKPEDRTLILGETTLDERAHRRVDFKERKRQTNLESITSAAAAELVDEEDVPDERPDEDWVTRFFNNAQDISSTQMQNLWGRLLAGEIKAPGSFSLRTLEFIRNLSPEEASLIDRVFRFALLPAEVKSNSCLYSGGDFLEQSAQIRFEELLYLQDLGLMNDKELVLHITMNKTGSEYIIIHGDHALVLKSSKDDVKYSMRMYKISSVGVEIVGLLSINTNLEYLREIGRDFMKSYGSARIVKVEERISRGVIRYTEIEEVVDTAQ